MLALFMIVMVPSHQLSPVALLGTITVLVVFNRITPRGLPLFLGVVIVAWISYMTVPYLRGHIAVFTEPFGNLGSNLDENVTNRVRGNLPHMIVVGGRIAAAAFIWFIAGLGFLRRQRNGFRDLTFVILGATPFGLLALQTYGGELLLRTFLFSLPFVAFFMAGLFLPKPGQPLSRPAWFGLVGLSVLLGLSFFVTRYGNEAMDYFTDDEVAAVDYVYDNAEPGSLIVSGTQSLPIRSEGYNTYRYDFVERAIFSNNLDLLRTAMTRPSAPSTYLILTRSQQASAELYLGWAPGIWDRFTETLAASPIFTLVYSNPDAQVYVLTNPPEATHQ
jgi:hypothetical protein